MRWWIIGVVAAFVGGVAVGAVGVLAVSHNDEQARANASTGADVVAYDPSLTTIEYEIVTDGMSVTHLSWVDVVDGVPTMMEKLGTPPPFRHVIQLPKDEPFDLTDLSVTGMGAATSTTTTCTLRVEGKVVARQSADGTYGVVSCAAPQ